MITFQKAQIEDADAIKNLLRETWTVTYAAMYPPEVIDAVTSRWHKLEFLQHQIQNPQVLFFVAKENNNIVGMCNTDQIQSDIVTIQRLYIQSSYQGRGLGSEFIRHIVTASLGAKKLRLEVGVNNFRARKFYEKHGFINIGEKTVEIIGFSMPWIIMESVL